MASIPKPIRQVTYSKSKLYYKQVATSKWTKIALILDKIRDNKCSIKELIYMYFIELVEEAKCTFVKMYRERFIEALLEEEEVLNIIQNEILKDKVLK